jgi:hypothetical protein
MTPATTVARDAVNLLKREDPALVPEEEEVADEPVLADPPEPRVAKPTASGLENR